MPVVAIVAGVIIRLYYDDHDPPHFHAIFGSDEMIIRISDKAVLAGTLPISKRRLILEWADENRSALQAAWNHCRVGEKPGRIK